MQDIVPGRLVEVLGVPRGIAKLVRVDGGSAQVEWFRSVGHNLREQFPCSRLEPAALKAGLRCFVTDGTERYWRSGRVLEERSGDPAEANPLVWVRLAGAKEAVRVPERYIWVRSALTPGDPTPALACGASESPFFHERRTKLLDRITRQRAAAQGLTALLSASVRLLSHQVSVVRRVLQDPVQRYLLADEVGLGKTIEAGVILRQLHLDDPQARSLVLTPRALLDQWRGELRGRFHLDPDGYRITVAAAHPLPHHITKRHFDMVVVDEAHHVAQDARRPDRQDVWDEVKSLCHQSPGLLLLSATPALHNEADFLAMLHLLEPSTYGLDDLEAFRLRVEGRQEIGRLLLRMKRGMSTMALRSVAGSLPELLPHDDWLQLRVAQLSLCLGAENLDRALIDEMVHEMRLHIGETHRIYRRLIRTRRDQIPEDVLPARAARPDHPPVTAEYVADDRNLAVFEGLESWREGALAAVWRLEGKQRNDLETAYAGVFRALVDGSSGWLETLKQVVSFRLGHPDADPPNVAVGDRRSLRHTPLFDGEREILQALLTAIDRPSAEGDQIDAVLEVLRHVLRKQQQRCVVFAGSPAAAKEIAGCLSRLQGPVTVIRHVAGAALGGSTRDAARSLAEAPRPAVLVCDQSGEEGLNLQAADVLLMFDLPWDLDRIEQRIGRLDRIGNDAEVRVRVLVPTDDRDDRVSLHEAWFRLLRDGLSVFSSSIADLQFLSPKVIADASLAALREGAEGVLETAASLPMRIAAERRLLMEQAILDSVETVDSQDDAGFFAALSADDQDEESLRSAVDDWLVGALRFEAEDVDGDRYWEMRARDIDPIRYAAGQNTDATDEQAARIESVQARMGTWGRASACADPRLELLRIGHPLLTQLQDGWEDEDRGRTYIMWRCLPSLPQDRHLIFFRADYILEASLDVVRTVLDRDGYYYWSERALRRRVDSWFPPRREVYCFDSELQPVESPSLVELLARPYRRQRDGGSDIHLDAERFAVIERLMPPDDWRSLCFAMRQQTEAEIRASGPFSATCLKAAERAGEETARRMDQLQRGLMYRGRTGYLPKGHTREMQMIHEERAVYAALAEGLTEPHLELDAIGAIILSAAPPDTEL